MVSSPRSTTSSVVQRVWAIGGLSRNLFDGCAATVTSSSLPITPRSPATGRPCHHQQVGFSRRRASIPAGDQAATGRQLGGNRSQLGRYGIDHLSGHRESASGNQQTLVTSQVSERWRRQRYCSRRSWDRSPSTPEQVTENPGRLIPRSFVGSSTAASTADSVTARGSFGMLTGLAKSAREGQP